MSHENTGKFTEKTKRKLAGRAGFQCSHPSCNIFLIGPHTDGENTVSHGVAAHIKGRKPGSARYDSNQSDKDRKHISNGIWMCWNHSVQIDNDEVLYPVEKPLEWKKTREEQAQREYANPKRNEQHGSILERPEERQRLDTDGRYRRDGLVISFSSYRASDGSLTMVKLTAEGEIQKPNELGQVAIYSVQAYLISVGLRGTYMHMLTQMRELKLKRISTFCPTHFKHLFQEFQDSILGIDWSIGPGMEGAVFDIVGGDVKGNGDIDMFMIDITCLKPEIFTRYMDIKSESR